MTPLSGTRRGCGVDLGALARSRRVVLVARSSLGAYYGARGVVLPVPRVERERMMRELDWISPLEVTDSHEERARQIDQAAEFGATYEHQGETHSFASLAPAALEANEQLSLELTGYSLRAAIRVALAEKLEREVLPYAPEEWLQSYPERLRGARQSAHWGIRVSDGKLIAYWDAKAGLSRLCPDDAREEAMRLRRRVKPAFDELRKSGHRFGSFVFTMPNYAPGKLRQGMKAMFERFKRCVLHAKDQDGEPLFPAIKGAIVVLEAPLGAYRDWNVHLNVILCVKGFLDFEQLRRAWYWNFEHMCWIGDAPGAFEGAFAEMIKYAVAATVAKSAEHAAAGKTRAPPMLEWTRDELLEWLRAMHGFRRTRTYGVLYGLEEPEAEDMGEIVWLGTIRWQGGRYVRRCALLDSIPEDKFSGLSPAERWRALIQALRPRELAGAGTLGDELPHLSALLTG